MQRAHMFVTYYSAKDLSVCGSISKCTCRAAKINQFIDQDAQHARTYSWLISNEKQSEIEVSRCVWWGDCFDLSGEGGFSGRRGRRRWGRDMGKMGGGELYKGYSMMSANLIDIDQVMPLAIKSNKRLLYILFWVQGFGLSDHPLSCTVYD